MRTLIYKRTHTGDPNPKAGVFGNNDCMGEVRSRDFDAVIGIGGISDEPRRHSIDGKLTWIGIGSEKLVGDPTARGPQVAFRHFRYFEKDEPLLVEQYPALAEYMYETNRRYIIHKPSLTGRPELDRDVRAILRLANNAPPSTGLDERDFRDTNGKCRVPPIGPAPCRTRRKPSKSRGRA
jgi:hypothetical protein